MIEELDALIALERHGTVGEAAARLRLTQSAVSKRIQALQKRVGQRLVERQGRRVRITPEGVMLLERARPLLAQLRGLAATVSPAGAHTLSIVLSDSIAASWGPGVLRRALAATAGLKLEVHVHRSVLALEYVRLGRYQAAISTDIATVRDLVRDVLVEEPMTLVRCTAARRSAQALPVITIDAGSATWKAIEPALRKAQPALYHRERVGVESFNAAIQMARAGFGDALVPAGLARDMQLTRGSCTPVPGVSRTISVFTRKSTYRLPGFDVLRAALARETGACFRRDARR